MKRVKVRQHGKSESLKRKWNGRVVLGWVGAVSEFLISCTQLSARGEENAITRALSAFSGKCGVSEMRAGRLGRRQSALHTHPMLINACSAF